MDKAAILNLVETAPYQAETAAKLEAFVKHQLSTKTYDFTLNKSLLKYYQISFTEEKISVVKSVLILSLMRLPSTDFLAMTYMIPTQLTTDPSIMTIQECADLLERGKYREFWEKYVPAVEIFSEAAGFVDSIRLFILISLSDTFKTIQKQLFQQQLGLDQSSIVAFCESNKFIEKISGDSVVFVSNDGNQNRVLSFDSNLRVDEGLKMVEFLRSARKE